MRPLEIVLLVADLVAFVALLVPRRGQATWSLAVAALPPLAAVAQVLGEAARWQMVPAYGLAALLLLAWPLKALRPAAPSRAAGLAGRLAAVLAIGLGALVLAVSIALPAILPVFRFPPPGGPYAIGTITYHWVDERRHEMFSSDPTAHREVMAQVWYPAEPSASSVRAPYVPNADALSSAVAPQFHLPGFALDHLSLVPTNAIQDAPVAADRSRFPVLVFESGVVGFRQSNTYQVEALVSRGYVVVGLDQPYASGAVVLPGGRRITGWTRDRMQPLIDQSIAPAASAPVVNGQVLANGVVPYLAQDVTLALDRIAALDEDARGRLHGRLDLGRIGTFGVSLASCSIRPAMPAFSSSSRSRSDSSSSIRPSLASSRVNNSVSRSVTIIEEVRARSTSIASDTITNRSASPQIPFATAWLWPLRPPTRLRGDLNSYWRCTPHQLG